MTQSKSTYYQYNNTFDAFRLLLKNDGFYGLYRGLLPSLFGVSHVVIQFPVYEYLKHEWNYLSSPFNIIFATIISKGCASFITYPHEVLRTRLHTQVRNTKEGKIGLIKLSKTLYKLEGIRGFYKGLVISLVRSVP
jgi:solute carrier family 25 folate transporter 32